MWPCTKEKRLLKIFNGKTSIQQPNHCILCGTETLRKKCYETVDREDDSIHVYSLYIPK